MWGVAISDFGRLGRVTLAVACLLPLAACNATMNTGALAPLTAEESAQAAAQPAAPMPPMARDEIAAMQARRAAAVAGSTQPAASSTAKAQPAPTVAPDKTRLAGWSPAASRAAAQQQTQAAAREPAPATPAPVPPAVQAAPTQAAVSQNATARVQNAAFPAAPSPQAAATQPAIQSQPAARSALPVGSVAFAPVVGASPDMVGAMTDRLGRQATARGIALATGAVQPAHTLRGYFSAFTDKGHTTVVYVWDVFDARGNRVHRIQGQEIVAGGRGQGWSNVTPTAMDRIADRTVADLAGWLAARKG